MGKRSFAVVFLGIFAIAALGLSSYMFIKNELLTVSTDVESGVQNVWYTERLTDIYYVETLFTEIPNLNITATKSAQEKLYILFSADCGVYLSGTENVKIQFKINGVVYPNPFVEVGGSFSGNLYSPITLQYSIVTGAAGAYTIAVVAISTDTGNWIKEMTLTVYSYL